MRRNEFWQPPLRSVSRKAALTRRRAARAANHLGDLIIRDRPRVAPMADLRELAVRFREWKARHYQGTDIEKATAAEEAFELVTDLQAEIIAQAAVVRGPDIPPGKP